MAEQRPAENPNHALGQQLAAPNRLPYLKITVSGSDGTGPEKPIGPMPVITIAIPRELSLRIASMHVMLALLFGTSTDRVAPANAAVAKRRKK